MILITEDAALVLNGGRCRHQYSDMLNQVYSSHLQAQIQQHAASNQSASFGRYQRPSSSAHFHQNNSHHQSQHLHHPPQHHYLPHETEVYAHQGRKRYN